MASSSRARAPPRGCAGAPATLAPAPRPSAWISARSGCSGWSPWPSIALASRAALAQSTRSCRRIARPRASGPLCWTLAGRRGPWCGTRQPPPSTAHCSVGAPPGSRRPAAATGFVGAPPCTRAIAWTQPTSPSMAAGGHVLCMWGRERGAAGAGEEGGKWRGGGKGGVVCAVLILQIGRMPRRGPIWWGSREPLRGRCGGARREARDEARGGRVELGRGWVSLKAWPGKSRHQVRAAAS